MAGRECVALSNDLGKVAAGDSKAAVDGVRCELDGIDHAFHKTLLKFLCVDVQLFEHGVKGSRFQFVFRVTNNGNLVPQVEGDMASLATSSVESKKKATLLSQLSHSFDELFSFMAGIVGQKCPIVKGQTSSS